jgi:CheY-like chemotaxis protein
MRTAEVLLIDDNPADTDLISEVLTQNGCPIHIRAVTDGVEAIAFLRVKESTSIGFFRILWFST